ncbi:hypothetical protein [Luteolibacter soli]|uniref:Uncharacterized protein n=1 Tax=Luteolibacter soli TaxID=3135280 RepID=A0ABU9ATA9_9BACT
MTRSRFHFLFPSVRSLRWMVSGGVIVALTACKESKSGASSASAPATEEKAPATPAPPAIEPLAPAALAKVLRQAVLIRTKDGTEITGMLLQPGGQSSGKRPEYLIVADTPTDAEHITFACHNDSGTIVSLSATRALVLPNGLPVYSFSSASFVLAPAKPEDGAAVGPVQACRLAGEGSLPDEERKQLEEKVTALRAELNELQKQQNDFRPADLGSRPSREDMEERSRRMREFSTTRSGLTTEIAKLNRRLTMPLDAIKVAQIATLATPEAPAKTASELQNTILAGSDGTVRAVRHGDQWISAKEVLDGISVTPTEVGLEVYGSEREVNVSCKVQWKLPIGIPDCVMLAATTYQLESVPGKDLADRLSKVATEEMSLSKDVMSRSMRAEWNGKPTSLWIRVFPKGHPESPVVDEMILLDYPGRFAAKWGKPPSPLVKPAKVQEDSPANLVKEMAKIDAGGTVLDLIAAGDGSVLMVRTDKPPYWRPFDLKTGKPGDAPWKAGPDTLLAAQAGKVYLVDRKTSAVEIWDLASGQRTGLQVLQLEGSVVAVAAPMSAANAPLLVATDKTASFVDPQNFEAIPNGFDMHECFTSEHLDYRRLAAVEPASLVLRASRDGALYTVSGDRKDEPEREPYTYSVTLDPSGLTTVNNASQRTLSGGGRRLSESLDDHGGGQLQLRAQPSGRPFPGSPGSISFMEPRDRKEIAELRNPPFIPPTRHADSGPLRSDRAMYLDTSQGVLVLPEEDHLHLIRLNLPNQPAAFPEFAFAGEELSIPLPPGRDPRVTLTPKGIVVIGKGVATWKVPDDAETHQVRIALEWTGELGSTMTDSMECRIIRRTPGPAIVSTDGKTTLPLRRAAVIPGDAGVAGFAGAGQVLLTLSSRGAAAWSIADGERLFSVDGRAKMLFGDFDQLYQLGHDGVFKSFDLRTGAMLKKTSFGKDSGLKGLAGITTGMASRGSLLAVEQDGAQRYLCLVDRKTLQSRVLQFPEDIRQRFFNPDFVPNMDGTTVWTNRAAVIRDGDRLTVKPFDDGLYNGRPDVSGRYIVGSDSILDIKAIPPIKTKFASLPGFVPGMRTQFDESGRYLLFFNREDSQVWVSVRDIAKPGQELCKLTIPGFGGDEPSLISSSKKLICKLTRDEQGLGIYDLDIPAMVAKLSSRADKP